MKWTNHTKRNGTGRYFWKHRLLALWYFSTTSGFNILCPLLLFSLLLFVSHFHRRVNVNVFIVLFVPWFLVVLDVFFSSLICFDAFSHSNWIECFVLNSYDLQQPHRFCSYYMISVRNSMLLQKPHKSSLSTMMWITTCMMCYKQTSVRVGRIKKKEVASYCEKRLAIAYSE